MRVCQVFLFLCSVQDYVTKEFRTIEACYAFGWTKEWHGQFLEGNSLVKGHLDKETLIDIVKWILERRFCIALKRILREDWLDFGISKVEFFVRFSRHIYQLISLPGATILFHVILNSITGGVLFESCHLYFISAPKYKNIVCKITVVFMHNRIMYLDIEKNNQICGKQHTPQGNYIQNFQQCSLKCSKITYGLFFLLLALRKLYVITGQ
jgi:uncharacterized protein YjiS (DUF1127 family)